MQKNVLRQLALLRDDPYAGVALKPLKEHQVHQRGLEDCRALKIPGPHEAEVRVVYRIEPECSADKRTCHDVCGCEQVVNIIAIGERKGSAVYRLAMQRLDDRPPLPRWARYHRGRR